MLVYLFDRDEAAKKAVAQAIRNAGGKVLFQSPHGFYLAANVPLDRLAVVARCDAVCAIERRFGAFDYQAPSQGQGGNSSTQGGKGLLGLEQIRELCGAEAVKKAGGTAAAARPVRRLSSRPYHPRLPQHRYQDDPRWSVLRRR